MRLAGKVIVIIGGSSGLGLSAATACVREGASVVAVGVDEESCAAAGRAFGSHNLCIQGDAVDPTVSERAVAAAVERFGRCDGLYHVAGGSGRRAGDGPLHEITDAGWQYTLNLNLTTLFNSNRAAVRHLLEAGHGGSVLNIGSVLGESPSVPHFATHAYAAAKAAAIGFTRSCAAYYAGRDIRFNLLAPALVETPMSRRAVTDPAILNFIKSKQPLDGGRIGRPDDLDEAVIFFLSDASRFCTGQTLYIDGGWGVSEGQTAVTGA